MTFINENPDLWPTLLLLFLLAITVFLAMMATNRNDQLKEQNAALSTDIAQLKEDLRRRESNIKTNVEVISGLRDENRELAEKNEQAKKDIGNLNVRVMALCKDVESLRAFNGDMHRVIDMDAVRLKERDRLIAELQTKVERLKKIRRS